MAGNMVEWIRERSRADAVALTSSSSELTYGDLFRGCDTLATQLLQSTTGARQGTLRVGVYYPSGLTYVPLAMSVLAAGCCFVPVPEELSEAEKTELLERSGLDFVIADKGRGLAWLEGKAERCGGLNHDEIEAAVWRVKRGPVTFNEEAFTALNPAFVRFSSGTTGRAKGVVLSHESLLERIRAANSGLGVGAGDRVMWVLPMAHHFAVSVVLYLYHGATTVIVEGSTMGEDLLREGRERDVTVMYGSPVHYRQLAAVCPASGGGWDKLRLAVTTASALDSGTAAAFREKFGRDLVQGLGIIEVGLPLLNLEGAADAPEALGKPQRGYECELKPHSDEILLKGPGMFDAYLDPWAVRSEVVDAEGWFATGDVGRVDERGRVFLVGRLKSVINVGGMKVFAEEVEHVLESHEGVSRALVEGRKHALYGEVPVARVIIKPEATGVTGPAIQRWCRERLSSYKVPLAVSFVDELPLTASGKLKRA